MKNTFREKVIGFLTPIVACSVMFFSCTKEYPFHTQPVQPNLGSNFRTTNYSGVDYFKGIIFTQGPVVPLVPALSEARDVLNIMVDNPTEQAGFDNLMNIVVNKIQINDSSFFTYFKQEVTSEDHERIAAAVDSGITLSRQAIYGAWGLSNAAGEMMHENTTAVATDLMIDMRRASDSLQAGLMNKAEFVNRCTQIFPGIDQTLLHGISVDPNITAAYRPGTCAALAVVFAIALAAVGYVFFALHLHTVLTTRYAVVWSVHIKFTGDKIRNNMSYDMINSIAQNL